MYILTIYYSVQNGGDGSAYPQWMESEDLVEWDQDHLDEGWGEPCTGSLTFESESPISFNFEVQTVEKYYLEHTEYGDWYDKDEFIADFYPDGLPEHLK